MRDLLWRIRKFQANYAWIDAARNPPLDLGTTYFVEDVARGFVSPDTEVTVVAATDGGYATTSNPYQPIIADWASRQPTDTRTVIVVFVPRREQNSGLLHPLIVHEIGHAIQNQHQLVDDLFAVANRLARWQARLKRFVDEDVRQHNVTAQESIAVLAQRLHYWLVEALCDSFAIHTLGPAYLYAFLAEVAPGNMDIAGDRHPPPRQRVRLMLHQLDRLGWAPVMRTTAPDLDGWIRDAVKVTPSYGGLAGFLVWSLDALATHVRDRIARHMGKKRVFTPDGSSLSAVRTLLQNEIPPAQFDSREAIPRQVIVLGSWLFALEEEGGDLDGVVAAPDHEVLAKLLPKSLEMSALVEAWGEK